MWVAFFNNIYFMYMIVYCEDKVWCVSYCDSLTSIPILSFHSLIRNKVLIFIRWDSDQISDAPHTPTLYFFLVTCG